MEPFEKLVLAVGFLLGAVIATCGFTNYYHDMAVKHEAAYYDAKTGAFTWGKQK